MTIIDNLGPNEWSRRAELVFAARHSNGCDAAALTGRWFYLRMMRLRRVTVLPNAPFNRLNLYPCTEVYVDPVTGIRIQAREFKS